MKDNIMDNLMKWKRSWNEAVEYFEGLMDRK
jgi:hypothetical protein